LLVIMIALGALPLLHAQSFMINYVGVDINGKNYLVSVGLNSRYLMIPLSNCTGRTDVEVYVDPLSALGIDDVRVILYNGTFLDMPQEYSPKFVHMSIDCAEPVYGLYVEFGNYTPLPPVFTVIPGQNETYTLVKGSLNITIPSLPGFNYLFSSIRVITVYPGDSRVVAHYVGMLNRSVNYAELGPLKARVSITDYLIFENNFTVLANGTTYVLIQPYYYYPQISPISHMGYVVITGAPWINYNTTCPPVNAPRLTPWGSAVRYINCSVSYSVKPILINLVGQDGGKLRCRNLYIADPKGSLYDSSIELNPLGDRSFRLVLGGIEYGTYVLGSIPSNTVNITLPLITKSQLVITDLLGKPMEAILYVSLNGIQTMLDEYTCIYPGNYTVEAVLGGSLINLGNLYLAKNAIVRLPVINSNLTVIINPPCNSTLGLILNTRSGAESYVIERGVANVTVPLGYLVLGDTVNVTLTYGNHILTSRSIRANGTGEVMLSPRTVVFEPLDILGYPINAELTVKGITYTGPGRYCIPASATTGFVTYRGSVYLVNLTSNYVRVRIWAIGDQGFSYVVTLSSLITLVILVLMITRWIRGNHDDGVIIIRLISFTNKHFMY